MTSPTMLQLRSEADDPRTRPSRLGQLAQVSPELALTVARNPTTTPEMLRRLSWSPERQVREAVCVHPRTPTHVVYRLATEMPEVFAQTELGRTWFRAGPGGAPRANVVRTLLGREHLPVAWIEALLAHPHPTFRVALALRSDLTPGLVAKLASDPSPHVRRAIAGREGIGPEMIAAFVRDEIARVRERIAGHAALAPEHRATLATDVDEWVRRAIAIREDLSPALAGVLFADASSFVRSQLARNPACPECLLIGFAAEHDSRIEEAVLANPAAPPEALAQVGPRIAARITYALWDYRMLVKHPRATPEIVAANLRAARPEVRISLVHDATRLSRETMLELAADPSERVASALSYRDDLSEEVLIRLYERPEGIVRSGAVRHRLAPAWMIEKGARDPDRCVRLYVVENPNIPLALLERLSRDEDPGVRANVAKHARDPALLERMTRDADSRVLYALAYNRSVPEEQRRRLLDHPSVRAMNSYW